MPVYCYKKDYLIVGIQKVPRQWKLLYCIDKSRNYSFLENKMGLTYIAKHIHTHWLIYRDFSLFNFHSV